MTESRYPRGGVNNPTLSIRTPAAVRKALQAYAASSDTKLSGAANAILEEWLRTHGWLADPGRKPVGPATDAVEAMDQEIEKDRRRSALPTGKRMASVKETGEEIPPEEWERFERANKKPRA